MAARTRKGVGVGGWSHDVRDRIKTSMLLNRLQAHALSEKCPQNGEVVKLEPTQIKAIEILLRKTVPDLSQIDGTIRTIRETSEMSDAELAAIATGRGQGAVAPTGGPQRSDPVH